MPVSQTKDVADHGHDRQAAGVVRPSLQPDLRVGTLHPQDHLEILTERLLEGVPEDFDFVREWASLKVLTEAVHQSVVDVWDDLVFFAMLLDQHVQRVAVVHPTNETSVLAEWNDRIASDREIFLGCLRVDRQQCIDEPE